MSSHIPRPNPNRARDVIEQQRMLMLLAQNGAPAPSRPKPFDTMVKKSRKGSGFIPSAPKSDKDVHTAVASVSSFIPYANPFPRTQHNPYAMVMGKLLHLSIENTAFERSAFIENDLAQLMRWVERVALPRFKPGMGPLPTQRFVKFVSMHHGTDFAEIPDPERPGRFTPAKRRHFVVFTNFPGLLELLHSPNLYVLCDRTGFRVCWDGYVDSAVAKEVDGHTLKAGNMTNEPVDEGTTMAEHRQDGTVSPSIARHDVAAMHAYGHDVRGMGLRARHRATEGLPCTSVRFDGRTVLTEFQYLRTSF